MTNVFRLATANSLTSGQDLDLFQFAADPRQLKQRLQRRRPLTLTHCLVITFHIDFQVAGQGLVNHAQCRVATNAPREFIFRVKRVARGVFNKKIGKIVKILVRKKIY